MNTFGAAAPVDELAKLGPPVIEDCAHGFGASDGKFPLGSRGRAAILSFYATKLIGAGEGGAVLTRDPALAGFVRDWRDYGDKAADKTRLNDKMTDLEAALAWCQLQRLDTLIDLRRRKAERYHEILGKLARQTAAFRLPPRDGQAVWYRYVVALRRGSLPDIVAAMRASGVHVDLPVRALVRRWPCLGSVPTVRACLRSPVVPAALSDAHETRARSGLPRFYGSHPGVGEKWQTQLATCSRSCAFTKD